MKHLFVSYELAVKLKEKGFDEPCFAGYNSKDRRVNQFTYPSAKDPNTTNKPRVYGSYDGRLKGIIKAPMYQQVIDWFRDKHQIAVEARYHNLSMQRYWSWNNTQISEKRPIEADEFSIGHKDYYSALTKGIEETLKQIKP